MMSEQFILCPVCGGHVTVTHHDKVNRCEYCASPVLGTDQDRNCANHPDKLGVEVCHVCNEIFCEDCIEYRVADYGGKLFTVVNCDKPGCVTASEWAKPLNREYQELVNMDWSDRIDNVILRVTGLGAVLMMIFELVFVISLLFLLVSNSHVFPSFSYGGFELGGFVVVILSIFGNLLSAFLLQTSLQVYIHERQLGSGVVLLILLIFESAFLIFRGLFFNLLSNPLTWLVPLLLGAFSFAVILVFIGSIMSIVVGFKKYKQFKDAREKLGLQIPQ